jgi:outer membrane protein assembly factor BamB
MIKKIKLLSLVLTVFLITNQGCKLREVVSPAIPNIVKDTSSIDTIWRSEIREASMTPILNSEGNIITSKVFSNPIGEVFELRDGKNGRLIWQWSDYFFPEYAFRGASIIFHKDVIIISKSYMTYAFDAITGKTLWRDNQKGMIGGKSMAIDEDGFIYHSFFDDSDKNRNIYVWRTRFDNIKWEQVFVYSDTVDNNRISLMNMVVTKNTKGEKIIVGTPVMFRTINDENTVMSKVLAYNIDLKKIEWQVDYNPDKSNFQFWNTNIIAKHNKIYVFAAAGTNYYLMAYKIEDGLLAFVKILEEFGVGLHFYKDMVIPLLNGNALVAAYDVNTGVEKWNISFLDKGRYTVNFDFYDSKIYKNFLISTQCKKILGINLDNGKEVFFGTPNAMNDCLQYGLAINEEKRWFYVQDRRYINCFTLPVQIK